MSAGAIFAVLFVMLILALVIGGVVATREPQSGERQPDPACDDPATDRQRAFLKRLRRRVAKLGVEVSNNPDADDPALTVEQCSDAIDDLLAAERKAGNS